MKFLEFLLLAFLVAIVTGSAMLELKGYKHIECYQQDGQSLDDCIKEQTR